MYALAMMQHGLLVVTIMIPLATGQRYDVQDTIEVDAPYFPTDGIVNGVMLEMKELMKEERSYMDQKLVEMTQKLDEAQQKIETMGGKMMTMGEQIVAMGEKMMAIEEKMVAMEEKLVEGQQNADELKENVEGVKEKLVSMEQEVAAVFEKVEVVERAVEEHGGSLKQEVAAVGEAVARKVNESEVALVRRMGSLASHQQLVEMKAKITTLVSSVSGQITEAMGDLVTVASMEEIVSQQMVQVVRQCNSCNLTETIAQVLDMATHTQHSVNELPGLINTTSDNTQACESLGREIARLSSERSTENEMIGASVMEMQEAVVGLNLVLSEILNYTRPPPPTTTLEPPSTEALPVGERTSCEDSTFIGAPLHFDVCGAAVRFRMCHSSILSYHCCRSCVASGQISEEGPWRYMNFPREVRFIDSMQLMRRL